MDIKKVKIAKCKICKGILMISAFPLCEKDSYSIKEFKEFAKEGYEIDVIDNPKIINWCNCKKDN